MFSCNCDIHHTVDAFPQDLVSTADFHIQLMMSKHANKIVSMGKVINPLKLWSLYPQLSFSQS